MYTAEQIRSALRAENISVYETHFCFDEDVDIVLKDDNIEDFIIFAKENQIRSVFYCFAYYDEDVFKIADDDAPSPNEYPYGWDLVEAEFEKRFREEQRIFNRKIDSLNFKRPFALSVFCIFNGVQVGIFQKESWIDEIPEKEECLTSLKEVCDALYEQALAREHAKEQADKAEVMALVMAHLDSTDDWHACTNQRLRRSYCDDLIDQYETSHGVTLSHYEVGNALEIRWNQYKASKHK